MINGDMMKVKINRELLKDSIIDIFHSIFEDISMSLTIIPNVSLIEIIAGIETYVRKISLSSLMPIYEELFKEILNRLRNGLLKAKDYEYLLMKFIEFHESQGRIPNIKKKQKNTLKPFHSKFLQTFSQEFFIKSQLKKPPKVYLLLIPSLIKLANLIDLDDRVFYDSLEEVILVFRKYREQSLFIKTSILAAFEIMNRKNLGKAFYKFKNELTNILTGYFQELAENKMEFDDDDNRIVSIKALISTKLIDFEMTDELQDLVLNFALKPQAKFNIIGFIEVFKYFFEEMTPVKKPYTESMRNILNKLLNGFFNINSYHYIYEIEDFLVYKIQLPLIINNTNNENDNFLQDFFHFFAVIQMKFLNLQDDDVHKRRLFIKNIKNFLVKYKSIFSNKKVVRFMSLDEYSKIFGVSKTLVLSGNMENSIEKKLLFFPLMIETFHYEMNKYFEICKNSKYSEYNNDFMEKLKFVGTLRYLLEIAGEPVNTKIDGFYERILIKSNGNLNLYKIIALYYVILMNDFSYKDNLTAESPALLYLKEVFSHEFTNNQDKPEISHVMFLLKVLEDKGLKDLIVCDSMYKSYQQERKNFKGLEHMKFSSFDFTGIKNTNNVETTAKNLRDIDPNRLNAATTYKVIMTSQLNILDFKSIFHFEKILSKEIQSLDIKKLGNLAEKFNNWDYQAMKFGFHLKHMLISYFSSDFSDFSDNNIKALNKIIDYLLNKKFLTPKEFMKVITSNSHKNLKNSPNFAVNIISKIILENNNQNLQIDSFYINFFWEIWERNCIELIPLNKFLLLGILSLFDNERVKAGFNEKNFNLEDLSLKPGEEFFPNVHKIPQFYLKKIDNFTEIHAQILRNLINFCLKNRESYKNWFEFLVEVNNFRNYDKEFVDVSMKLFFEKQNWIENFDSLKNPRNIIDCFCFFWDSDTTNFENKESLLRILRSKLLKIREKFFPLSQISALLKIVKTNPNQNKLRSFIEQTYFNKFKYDYDGLKQVYLAYINSGLATEYLLENIEKILFKNENDEKDGSKENNGSNEKDGKENKNGEEEKGKSEENINNSKKNYN